MPTTNTVKKSITHDRLSVSVKYPTGGTFRFNVSRSGETMTFGGSNDPAIAKQQQVVLAKFTQFQGKETNNQRIERIAAKLAAAKSIGQLCDLVRG